VVGLSRTQTETLQDQLVEAGLVPRIGPAPEGTAPLVSPRAASAPWLLIAAAAIVVVGVLALLASRDAGAPSGPDAAAPPGAASPSPAADDSNGKPRDEPADEAIPPELRLELWAQARSGAAGVELIGLVRGRGGEDPDGPLTLVARVAGLDVVNESIEKPPVQVQRRFAGQGEPLVLRTVPFRVAVERAALRDARELVLRARWGDWRSAPLIVRLPGG
jgi:hypothetical protein